MTPKLDAEYRSLDEAVDHFNALETSYRQARNRRAVFLTVYLAVTMEMRRRVSEAQFLDNPWVSRYTLSFANLYRAALSAYERADGTALPKSWRIAFDAAKRADCLVVQDLLLGVNAHINHDLALALDEVSIEPDRQSRHTDHTAVNGVLAALTDAAQDKICSLYAPGFATIDEYAGRFDEEATGFSLRVARQCAWEGAVALANARHSAERLLVRKGLDYRSATLARLLLVPTLSPLLMDRCRKMEAGTTWWQCLPTPSELLKAAG